MSFTQLKLSAVKVTRATSSEPEVGGFTGLGKIWCYLYDPRLVLGLGVDFWTKERGSFTEGANAAPAVISQLFPGSWQNFLATFALRSPQRP